MSVYRLEDTSGTAKDAISIYFPLLTARLQIAVAGIQSERRSGFLANGMKCDTVHLPSQLGCSETSWSNDLSNGLEILD